MKTLQPIDRFSVEIPAERRKSVYEGAKITSEKRTAVLAQDYPDPDRLRAIAGQIKQHTLDHLDRYLRQAEDRLLANGAKVHFARDGRESNETVLSIMRENGCGKVVKSKSMLGEETDLNRFLTENGVDCLETDLGELIVQLDNDHPSHIVRPIIHKNRKEIAECFEREGLGAYNDEPEVITRRARNFLRERYMQADTGLTGANFVVAESGRISLVTNEGNARFCMAATRVHIVIVGIEKIIPRDRDLALFHNLLARSGTGQQLTVYNQFIGGPRAPGQPHGPEQMHVVFVDNRRTEVLASDCREILRCIRCGACQNVCPIYRRSSGFAYRSNYGGPVGAVLSPLLAGEGFADLADLPKASSLCGACNEVCPVDIPIPDLLLRLRDRAKREGARKAMAGTPPMGVWALLASQPAAWKASLKMGFALDYLPAEVIPVPALRAWQSVRKLPPWRGGKFRQWMRERGGEER
jgi:L-lactate dehydrogenase complex protein LldF